MKYSDYILYTPPTNFVGTDSFRFTAADQAGNTVTGVVEIVVLPPLRINTTGTNLQFTSQGFHLQVDGVRGTNSVAIYASTNLVEWEMVPSSSLIQRRPVSPGVITARFNSPRLTGSLISLRRG